MVAIYLPKLFELWANLHESVLVSHKTCTTPSSATKARKDLGEKTATMTPAFRELLA
jgi:hypothetical protein